jgi:ElaB/YqjD/DUF883 family membrane-anchored ribosome-binding protein
MADDLPDTDQIERDLARTRARMDERLDALQDKMAPAQIVNDAFAHIAGDDGTAFTERLIARAKANPLAVALTGAGFAWLMMPRSERSHDAGAGSYDLSERLRSAEAQVQREAGEPDDAFDERLHAARGRVLGLERKNDEAAVSYAERITQALASARQTLGETAHDAKLGAADAFSGASARFGRTANTLHQGSRNMAQNTRTNLSSLTTNPLALGGLAAIAGLIAGALLPTFEVEERALGSTASKIKSSGRDLAQDLADKGGEVVNQALDTARESAAREGLTMDKPIGETLAALKNGDLVESVKQVAADTLEAGKGAAQVKQEEGQPSNPTGQA